MQAFEYFEGKFDSLETDYAPLLAYANECNHLRYSEFDRHTVHRVNLFAIRESFDFASLETTLDVILKALPAIKRIFAKPIIRLKDTGAILPVESVRLVNHATVVHASSHSELWDDITETGLKPRKLLTLRQEDHYAIYENILFAQAIDLIMRLVGRNIRLLKDMLYVNRNKQFNLLERENHPAYFLAIGKLHIGYLRDYEQYREPAERCLDKLLFIDRVIRTRLSSPVYKHCRGLGRKLTLKKTNIFRNHKDYRRIYNLLGYFSDARLDDGQTDEGTDPCSGYRPYCSMLALFAAGHFNFSFGEDQLLDFFHLNAQAVFSQWTLKLETVFCEGIAALRFTFMKDVPYRIILLPAADLSNGRAMLDRFGEHYAADEYLLADPYEASPQSDREEKNDRVYLSLFDIESFRRIQQLLLRGMIGSDRQRTICPFCGRALVRIDHEEGTVYECGGCRTQILHLTCPELGQNYTATSIKHLTLVNERDSASLRTDRLLYGRYIEAQMHFRNITEIGEGAELICPCCHRRHTGLAQQGYTSAFPMQSAFV